MKTTLIKVTAILIAFTASFSSCDDNCGCKKTENLPQEKICDVQNPLKDLPWLKKYINDVIKNGEFGAAIYLCSYQPEFGISPSQISK